MNKITHADVLVNIQSTWFINGATGVVPDDFQPPVGADSPLNQLVICVLLFKSGYTVTGEAFCADPKDYDKARFRHVALENAKSKAVRLAQAMRNCELQGQLATA